MRIDWTTIIIAICLTTWIITHYVLLPMFNSYLEYKLRRREMEANEKWNEGLQRDNDDPDIKQRSGKSDERASLHDEELPL